MSKKPLIGVSANVSPPNDEKRQFNIAVEIYYIQQHYMTFVERGGGVPVLLTPPADMGLVPEMISHLDGLLIVGGVDVDPSLYGEDNTHSLECDLKRDKFDIELVNIGRDASVPILGICRGTQIMNVAYGGDMFQDIPTSFSDPLTHGLVDKKESFHQTEVDAGNILRDIVESGEIRTNSSHHQSIRTTGDGLEIIARAADGVVEAIADSSNPGILGVQWHPERMQGDDRQIALARWLVDSSRK